MWGWLLGCGGAHTQVAVQGAVQVDPRGIAERFPDAVDLALWSEDKPGLGVQGEELQLGSHTLLLNPSLVGEGGCGGRPLEAQHLEGDAWREIHGPPLGTVLDLALQLPEPPQRRVTGLARLELPPVPAVPWELMVWDTWTVLDISEGGQPVPFLRRDHALFVALAEGEGPRTVEIAFASDDAQGAFFHGPVLEVNSMAVPWAETFGEVRLHLRPTGERTWLGAATEREGDGVQARWEGAMTSLWALSGHSGPLTVSELGGVKISTPPELAEHHERLLARAEATLQQASSLGLQMPWPLELAVHQNRFSRAGAPLWLSVGSATDPRWEHVVAHEAGHLLLGLPGKEEGPVGEASAAWLSTWVDDPDGPVTRGFLAGGSLRCALLSPHARDFQLDTQMAGHLLVALEDRMGRAELVRALQQRTDGSWSALLRELPDEHQRWMLSWLLADRWPVLELVWTEGGFELQDNLGTGLQAEIEVELHSTSGVRRQRLPFPSEHVPLEPDVETIVIDPRVRLPVVADRSPLPVR